MRPRIAVSSCLTGALVRHDGGHTRAPFVADKLAKFADLTAICPEVEAGMGIPRETVRLVHPDRLVAPRRGTDWTDRVRGVADARAAELAGIDGYVFKKDSPSCGLHRVRVWSGDAASRDGRGTYAAAVVARFPLLPVEEEGRLQDPRLRENFVLRVFVHARLRGFFAGAWTVGALVELHASLKMLLLSQSPVGYTTLGPLVAHAKATPRDEVVRRYLGEAMRALASPATRGGHVNALRHVAGWLKHLPRRERRDLHAAIEDYQDGHVPLVAPMTVIRHQVARHEIDYLARQLYLEPYPKELGLRNAV